MSRTEIGLERLMTDPLTRRRLLATAGGLTAAAALSRLPGDLAWAADSKMSGDPFALGVASGDPRPFRANIWTRLAPRPLLPHGGMPGRKVRVGWEVARDEDMRHVVGRGAVAATPALAHSVHVEVRGLLPRHEYFYRFRAGDAESRVGRILTAPRPTASLRGMQFAFASCQAWQDGYYSPYRRMLDDDLDVVIHLGDYIYEGGIDADGGNRELARPLPPILQHETMTLADYRVRHALYKTDPDLQAVHARFPWIVTWDDHEVENDYADDAPEGEDPSAAFRARRAAAYQAYYEHLPLPDYALPRGPDMRIYRRIDYGDIARFNVLDTRQYRDDQPCGEGEFLECGEEDTTSITGAPQERWLKRGLTESRARWNVLAQQVMMGMLRHEPPGTDPMRFWGDAWDGYQGQRRRLLRFIADRDIRNPVVITGDWHSTFVNDLKANFRNPEARTIATEFVGTSITSNGDEPVYGPYYGPMIPFNPHIKFFDGDRRGYVRCTLDRDTWRTDLQMVTSVSNRFAPEYTLASFVVEDGRPGAQRL
jgi:alkaline phosphatase D